MSAYLKDLAERVLATSAATFLAYVGGDMLDVLHFDWGAALSVTAGAAILTFAKALAVRPIGNPDTGGVVA